LIAVLPSNEDVAQPRARADRRQRASLAGGALVAAHLGGGSARALDPELHGSQSWEYADHMTNPVISCSPDVMGGTPVFASTRVPVQTLLDYLEAGDSIDDFLAGFPSVSREQVIAFLEQAKDRLVAAAS
jgi:uncharacterized protein (DUF433 family)